MKIICDTLAVYEKYHRHVLGKIYNVLFCALYICWGIGK